jgi:hypothetical protein
MEYFAGCDKSVWESATPEWRWMLLLERFDGLTVEGLIHERDRLNRMRRQESKIHLLRAVIYGCAAIFTLAVYVAFGFVGPKELLVAMGLHWVVASPAAVAWSVFLVIATNDRLSALVNPLEAKVNESRSDLRALDSYIRVANEVLRRKAGTTKLSIQ